MMSKSMLWTSAMKSVPALFPSIPSVQGPRSVLSITMDVTSHLPRNSTALTEVRVGGNPCWIWFARMQKLNQAPWLSQKGLVMGIPLPERAD